MCAACFPPHFLSAISQPDLSALFHHKASGDLIGNKYNNSNSLIKPAAPLRNIIELLNSIPNNVFLGGKLSSSVVFVNVFDVCFYTYAGV